MQEVVRCKVRLNNVLKHEHSQYVGVYPNGTLHKSAVSTAQFSFVTAGDGDGKSEENKRFWEATPSGKFEVSTHKEMPWQLGQEFYIDIIPAAENPLEQKPQKG